MRSWKTLILGAFLVFGLGFGVTACEVEDSDSDATGTADTTGGSDTTGGDDTGGGECPSPTTPDWRPGPPGVPLPLSVKGCGVVFRPFFLGM